MSSEIAEAGSTVGRAALEPMLEARSVAVVGASVKEGSLGHQMMVELARGGYGGEIYPVNPGYEEVLGHRCYPSIADAPIAPDLAILGVANHRIERALADAVAAGARSVVTFSSLHDDEPLPDRPPLIDRLVAIANGAGIALCGGNGMGFLNLGTRLRATGFPTSDCLRVGPITFVSHSGSAFAAFAFNDRGLGFNLVVSSGQEIVTTMADYMEYSLGLHSTKVLALLLETVRQPELFRGQLARAADLGIPVIVLTAGRTDASKAMVVAHSGAMAGEHGAYEALFDAYGVHEVRTLDEMADTMELFSASRRVSGGARGVASVHDSGGERALFADLAHDVRVPFASISDATRDAIQQVLDPGLVAENPLDAWGTGIDADRIFRDAFLALHDDSDTAAMAFVVDLTHQGEPYDEGYLQVALDVWRATTKPFCVLSNLSSAVDAHEVRILREAGIPVLEGTESGLWALRHLLDDRDVRVRTRAPISPATPVDDAIRERWRARLAEGGELSELEGLRLLGDFGVSVIPARIAGSAAEAVGAAEALGWPVALKTAKPGIHHKSDAGGVKLALADATALREAYQDLSMRLGPRVVVAQMAPAGVEVALGIVRDRQLGPLVMVAAGGVLVELLKDWQMALPPVDEPHARRLIDGLKIRPLLNGVRGAPAADVASLAAVVARLSVLALDLGDHLEALDVNPVIASPGGCVAVDALVVSRA